MAANRRLALLIDGDNAQATLLGEMLAEASKYGLLTIRRVYGDWTEPQLKSWKQVLHAYAIQPVQQFRYTSGKNATDSAMIWRGRILSGFQRQRLHTAGDSDS
jgi:hypothetical protein